MLPASQTPRSQSQRSAVAGQWQIGLIVFLVLYTLAVGAGLVLGVVRPERAHLLFIIPCLLPMVWCLLGLRKGSDEGESDSGLMLSAAGWFLIACSFFFKTIAVVRAGADAYASQASSPASWICAGLGVLLLLAGALFSWQFWTRNYTS